MTGCLAHLIGKGNLIYRSRKKGHVHVLQYDIEYIISTISKTNLSIMETCIYLYVYLSISNIYLHVCLSVSISIYLSIYLCGRAHLDTHKLYIYIYIHIYIYVCMCVCMFLSMYVNMCVFTYR